MFKKFVPKEDIASSTSIKSSVQRGIRTKLLEQLPLLKATLEDAQGEGAETLLDRIWPKKEGLTLVKCREHVSILVLNGEPLFFQHFDGPYYPTLRLLHKYPDLLPKLQVDTGAIKFVLAGANVMCPGLLTPTAKLPDAPGVPEDAAVAVMAYGKEHACAIGKTLMSSEGMKQVRKGVGIENLHWVGDDLWMVNKL